MSHRRLLSPEMYGTGFHHRPQILGEINLVPPAEPQYVLRMLISRTCGLECALPEFLHWTAPIVCLAAAHQRLDLSGNPYVYLTVRHGPLIAENDDVWHVDGFAMRTPHAPEHNYVWVDTQPTQWWEMPITLPEDFQPSSHNIHDYFQRTIGDDTTFVRELPCRRICRLTPYVVHRRPPDATGQRTFVRVSFCPIPIHDRNNTPNPDHRMFQMHGGRDGVAQFRDHLVSYHEEKACTK